MTHMTQGYPFEWKVLGFANNLSRRLAGDGCTFLMVLNSEGALRTLQFEHSESSWHDLTQQLKEADESHVFYDPFDAPEYTWISWHNVERPTMERLIGKHFDGSDFAKSSAPPAPHPAYAAPELEPVNTFPVSWGVMF